MASSHPPGYNPAINTHSISGGGQMIFKCLQIAAITALVFTVGCTTEAAKKAMAKPLATDQYSGFDSGSADGSKRKAELPKPVSDSVDPETAVSTLVDQLQNKQASFSIAAEEQLGYWGSKPGVAPIVVRKVRPLLKASRVEQRAPALRLTVQFGGRECAGDLIECLADSEPGIRDNAYRSLQGIVTQDFGYDPNSGETLRSKSIDQYRRWWQSNQRRVAVQPATVYEKFPPSEARVITPGQ